MKIILVKVYREYVRSPYNLYQHVYAYVSLRRGTTKGHIIPYGLTGDFFPVTIAFYLPSKIENPGLIRIVLIINQ
jgi:hypothetical protein